MGWLISRNSRVVRWAWAAFSLSVRTTMQSVTWVLQAIWSLGAFSTSTRHMRQLPSTGRSGCQQKWGMWIPASRAAWITVVPAGTSISFPSITHLGISSPERGHGGKRHHRDTESTEEAQRADPHVVRDA